MLVQKEEGKKNGKKKKRKATASWVAEHAMKGGKLAKEPIIAIC